MNDHEDRDKTPTASSFNRPSASRKVSSSQWSQREVPAQVVLSKLSSLLLTPQPNARLKATYRVFLPSRQTNSIVEKAKTLLRRGTQRLMRIIPTSWVDVLLALRRSVSLRRAGLIGQGPRPKGTVRGSSFSTSSSWNDRQVARYANASSSRGGPGPASSTHLRSSVRPVPEGISPPPTHANFPDSDEGENSGMSGPPSLPDSNSGESHDGMTSSGVLSVSSHEGDPQRDGASVGSESTTTMVAGEGPWIGPEEEQHPEEEGEQDQEEEPAGDESSATASSPSLDASTHRGVGDSWVQLSGSQARD